MSALPRWYNAERQAARLDRALRRVMREVSAASLPPGTNAAPLLNSSS